MSIQWTFLRFHMYRQTMIHNTELHMEELSLVEMLGMIQLYLLRLYFSNHWYGLSTWLKWLFIPLKSSQLHLLWSLFKEQGMKNLIHQKSINQNQVMDYVYLPEHIEAASNPQDPKRWIPCLQLIQNPCTEARMSPHQRIVSQCVSRNQSHQNWFHLLDVETRSNYPILILLLILHALQ